MQGFKAPMLVNLFVVLIAIASPPINGLDSRKLDENSVPGSEKCTPCTQYPPPSPSPPPPSPPPPPASPPPSPPSPKKPPSQYCPPPPSPPSFLYITGPPGNLYPVDENFNGATKKNLVMGLPFLVGFGLLLGLVAF